MENTISCKKCRKKLSFEAKKGKGMELVECDGCKTVNKVSLCPCCGSDNVYGVSRVVGYFSKIDNWNKSKTAEFADRQKGNYGF